MLSVSLQCVSQLLLHSSVHWDRELIPGSVLVYISCGGVVIWLLDVIVKLEEASVEIGLRWYPEVLNGNDMANLYP